MTVPNPKMIALTILAFVVASFSTQALSHFLINADHYASISFLRQEPIMFLGILTMILQGGLLGWLYPHFRLHSNWLGNSLTFALAFGAFLALYIGLVEPAKYQVESVSSWMMVELGASTIQFVLFGVFLGLIHRKG